MTRPRPQEPLAASGEHDGVRSIVAHELLASTLARRSSVKVSRTPDVQVCAVAHFGQAASTARRLDSGTDPRVAIDVAGHRVLLRSSARRALLRLRSGPRPGDPLQSDWVPDGSPIA